MGNRSSWNIASEPPCPGTIICGYDIELDKYGSAYIDERKWYYYDEDMTAHSKLHPDVLFTVERKGTDWTHHSITYFYNGETLKKQADRAMLEATSEELSRLTGRVICYGQPLAVWAREEALRRTDPELYNWIFDAGKHHALSKL